MRTTNTVPTIGHPLIWQTLAALITAGALLAIPTPVAADGKIDAQAFETPRVALSAKTHKPAARLDPLRKQLKGLPKHNLRAARQEAAFARRVLAARLPAPDRPQKPRLLDGWQIRSIDGDTFIYGTERIRIRGLNVPKPTEVGGFAATQRLELLLHEGPVMLISSGKDARGRTLAEVYVNNRNIAEVMREEGHNRIR